VIVEKQVGETTITFDVAIPYSIASDGKIQTIEIQRTNIPAEYKYVTVPKMSPLAYLTGNIINWAELSLQSGEATLYFENTFVGKSYLNINQLSRYTCTFPGDRQQHPCEKGKEERLYK